MVRAGGIPFNLPCICDGKKTQIHFKAANPSPLTPYVRFWLTGSPLTYVSHTCDPFEINYTGGQIEVVMDWIPDIDIYGSFSAKITLVDCNEIPVYRWWCVGGECVQSETMPGGATGGPWTTKADCEEGCAGASADPWWCVDGSCVQAATSPPGATGGPYASFALCGAGCVPPEPDLKYWCSYGVCQSGYSKPHADATGPFDLPGDCSIVCGPAEMVWICAEDTGVSTISKWEAIQLGYTYFETEAEAETTCSAQFWCVPQGCVQWWGGTAPPDASAGPWPTLADCQINCDPLEGPGYYCVEGICGFYGSRPVGATGFRADNFAACMDLCVVLSGAPTQADGAPVQIQSEPIPPPPPPPAPRQPLKVIPPCFNRSEVPIDRAGCNCVDKWVFSCKVHGKCRLRKDFGDGITVCEGCNDWEEV